MFKSRCRTCISGGRCSLASRISALICAAFAAQSTMSMAYLSAECHKFQFLCLFVCSTLTLRHSHRPVHCVHGVPVGTTKCCEVTAREQTRRHTLHDVHCSWKVACLYLRTCREAARAVGAANMLRKTQRVAGSGGARQTLNPDKAHAPAARPPQVLARGHAHVLQSHPVQQPHRVRLLHEIETGSSRLNFDITALSSGILQWLLTMRC